MRHYYDIIKYLFKFLDYKTVFSASQVCKLWNRVGKDIIQEILKNKNIRVRFKIEKLRFLVPNSIANNDVLDLRINNKKSIGFFRLKIVNKDKDFTIYESDAELIKNWIQNKFHWRIHGFEQGQIVPSDLSQQSFKLGMKYKGLNEQSVIGSGRLQRNNIICCCPIRIVYIVNIRFCLLDE
jgi:hypothetical protein